jgi:Protein of unknown function (DUF998)
MVSTARFRPAPRPWLLAVLAGLVGYCDFPLQWVIGSPLRPTRSYISELSVAGQPAYEAFRVGDLVAGFGLAVLAAVLLLWRPSPPMRLGSAALTVAAATAIIDAMSPMTCTPSTDIRCGDGDHAAVLTQLSQLHTGSGVIGFAAMVIAMAAYGTALRRQSESRLLGAAGLAVAVVGAVLGGVQIGTALAGSDWTGLFERIQVLTMTAYLTVLTGVVARSAGRASRSAVEPVDKEIAAAGPKALSITSGRSDAGHSGPN